LTPEAGKCAFEIKGLLRDPVSGTKVRKAVFFCASVIRGPTVLPDCDSHDALPE
jgi:hypothetical protein